MNLHILNFFLEIKNRFILGLISGFSILCTIYSYKEILLFIIVEPNIHINFEKSLEIFYFIFTDVTEVFLTYLELVIFFSFQMFYMYLIYHFFFYFSSAFFYSEYLYFKSIIKFVFFIWILLGIFNTYFLVPFTWSFFLSFQNITLSTSFMLYFEIKLKEYLLFYISFYYICEFYFQLFLFYWIILDYTKSNLKIIKKFRKIYYYCFIILSTMITPPDFFSQILISLVFILAYEFLILFFSLKNKL